MSTQKQFKRFFLVGLLAFSSDIASYYFFTALGMNLNIAKGTSFVIGTLLGYLLNTKYTFEKSQFSSNTLTKYLTVYLCSMILNVTVNIFSITLLAMILANDNSTKFFAVIMATGVSMIFNFVSLKYYVYKK